MDWKLELILLPVSDVDRAKTFYLEKVGFELLVDTPIGDGMRVVQMTPPGLRLLDRVRNGADAGRARLGRGPAPGRP